MSEKNEEIHQKWVKWLEEMSKHVKYDVTLYRLKNIYEHPLTNPREHPNEELLGELDLLATYVYEYDGGVIGRGGNFKVLENTYYFDDVDIKDDNDRLPNEKQRRNRIKEVFQQKNGIRIGLFTHQIGCPPSFYLISSREEDQKIFSRPDSMLYDGEESCLYYSIRYDISQETYYVLSGMTAWTDKIFKEIVAPPCPDAIDQIDSLRYIKEYLEGEDLDQIYSELQQHRQKAEDKYGLTRMEADAILKKQL